MLEVTPAKSNSAAAQSLGVKQTARISGAVGPYNWPPLKTEQLDEVKTSELRAAEQSLPSGGWLLGPVVMTDGRGIGQPHTSCMKTLTGCLCSICVYTTVNQNVRFISLRAFFEGTMVKCNVDGVFCLKHICFSNSKNLSCVTSKSNITCLQMVYVGVIFGVLIGKLDDTMKNATSYSS